MWQWISANEKVITATVAILALIQPWVFKVYDYVKKKYFSNPVIKCFANDIISITYDGIGAGVYFIITLISKNNDSVITYIGVKIYKDANKVSKVYDMDWYLLSSVSKKRTYSDWGLSSTDRESMLPCPMYLNQDKPLSYGFYFQDKEIKKYFDDITLQFEKRGKAFVKETLLTKLNFIEGKHYMDIVFTDINGTKETVSYSFTLSAKDIEILQYNMTIICDNIENDLNESKEPQDDPCRIVVELSHDNTTAKKGGQMYE